MSMSMLSYGCVRWLQGLVLSLSLLCVGRCPEGCVRMLDWVKGIMMIYRESGRPVVCWRLRALRAISDRVRNGYGTDDPTLLAALADAVPRRVPVGSCGGLHCFPQSWVQMPNPNQYPLQ